MKKSLRFSPVALSPWVLTGLAVAGLTGCVQEPPAFDPRATAAWESAQDNQIALRPKEPLPTTAESPNSPEETPEAANRRNRLLNVPEGPPVKMSLQEIIHRAMANNLEIRVASYDTAVDQTRIMEAVANFDPTIFSDFNIQRVDKQTAGSQFAVPNAAGTSFARDITVAFDQELLGTADVGIRQKLPSGGTAEIKQEFAYSWFNPPRTLLRSYYENDLVFTLTQPLLQNYGVEVNEARITVARFNQRVSLMDFRKTVEDTVLKIEQVYWQQVQAERDVATTRKLIAESQELYDVLLKRAINDVTNVETDQARAELSQHEVTLIQLQNQVANLSDQLKQLMNDPAFPVVSSAIITPMDEGTEVPLHFNLDDQIETAMQNRYELGQQQARIDSANVSVKVAISNRLPSLTAQVQSTLDGLGHDLGRAFSKEGDFNHWGYQFGLQFEFPLGNRAPVAIWQRALLQRMQAITSYAGLVNQIALDVKTAARQVDSSWDRLIKARESRLFYQKLVDDLGTRRLAGGQDLDFNFVFNLLQDQQQLAQAEQTEHQALNDYNFAIATLEKNKGTILRYNNVMMEQEQLPFDMAVNGSQVPRDRLMGEYRNEKEQPVVPVVVPPLINQPVLPTDPMR